MTRLDDIARRLTRHHRTLAGPRTVGHLLRERGGPEAEARTYDPRLHRIGVLVHVAALPKAGEG